MTDFEDFIPDPTLLVGSAVEEQEPYVAILVSARAVVRSTWTDEVEVSPATFAQLERATEPGPSFTPSAPVRFRHLDSASRQARPRKCRACLTSPGRQACSVCGGVGRIGEGEAIYGCMGCEGGYLTCSVCDGTKRSVPVTIVFGEHAVRSVAHIFLPAIRAVAGGALVDFLRARSSVPQALRIELSDEFTRVDAYRGRRGDDEVRGHRAGTALAHARTYVERLGKLPSVVALEHEAYAWPFVVCGSAADDLFVSDENGKTCQVA